MVHVWTSENSWIPWPYSGSYYYGYRWLLLTNTGTDSRCTHHVAVTLLPSFPVDAKAPETTGPWLALRWATRKLEVPQDHGINLPQWKGRGRDYTWCSFSPWWLVACGAGLMAFQERTLLHWEFICMQRWPAPPCLSLLAHPVFLHPALLLQ